MKRVRGISGEEKMIELKRLSRMNTVTLAVVVLGFVNADGMVQMKWICHSTVCEEGIHFCNEQSKRCEACEDYAAQCFSNLQQRNCTKFCMGRKFRQIREQGCKVPTLRHGHQIGSQAQVNYRQRIEVECADGYTMIGEKMLICEEYGQWSPLPICKATTCKLPTRSLVNGYFTFIPPKIHNKTVESEAEILVGSTLSFHCLDGFRLSGLIDITCTSRGRWDSHKLPSCVRENVIKSGKSGTTRTPCVLQWMLVWVIGGILILVVIVGIVLHVVICQRKSTETCQSRSAEPRIQTKKNGEANGFVPMDNAREETKAFLPEGSRRGQNASLTSLKHLGDFHIPASGLSEFEDSDAASTSGECTSHVSDDPNTSRQQEQENTADRTDRGVIIIPGNKKDSAGPPNPQNTQSIIPDTNNGIPMQETDQNKSPSVRSVRPVQPRSDDTGRSMEQASMPKQETTGHVTPITYAIPQP